MTIFDFLIKNGYQIIDNPFCKIIEKKITIKDKENILIIVNSKRTQKNCMIYNHTLLTVRFEDSQEILFFENNISVIEFNKILKNNKINKKFFLK